MSATPVFPQPPQQYEFPYMLRLVQNLQSFARELNGSHGRLNYVIANLSELRTLDMATATQDEINRFVVTAISDLFRARLMP